MKRFVSLLAISLAGVACLPAGAQAEFGLGDFDVSFTESDGSFANQAGSHPFAFTTSFEAEVDGEETDGRLRELFLDLPPGLIADTTAYPRCAATDFLAEAGPACSLATVVGTSTSTFLEADNSEAAPVYSLVAPEGAPLRLGFRIGEVASVVVDVGLNPDPPHNPIAVAGDWPETVDVFFAEVQLWGVPAHPAHDALRGGQAGVPARPFLTLPTSCDGPLATFFEAVSWDALSDDGESSSLGMTGCGFLAFQSLVTVQPTTEAAQSPTGLELGVDFFDEGLTNPDGIAESQVRDLVLTLPEGMGIDPSGASHPELCSPTQLGEESPQAIADEGCPEGARIGTLEVESPLLEGALEGNVYLATPLEDLAGGSPVDFYAVAKSAVLGIVIKQVVEAEPDPETGQLAFVAKDIPQLPFSHVSLRLFESVGSPLVSPPFCDDYTVHTQLTPWAADVSFGIDSTFEIETGPGGGPCPSGGSAQASDGDQTSGEAGPSGGANRQPLDPGPVAAGPVASCPKGKRAIRRNGIRHCMKRCPKGKRKAGRKGAIRCVKKRSCPKGKRMVRRQGKARCVRRSRSHRYP